MSESNIKKDRWFSIVTYSDEYLIKRVIKNKGQYIRAWAYIIHDKDKTDKHIHVLLRTYQAYTFSAIRNWFYDLKWPDDVNNTFCQAIKDKSAAVDYLTHKHEPNEYQYNEDDIIAQNLNEFTDVGSAKDNSYEIIVDMISGVPFRSLAYKYGRDFIYHYKAYAEVVKNIIHDERKAMNTLNMHIDYTGENEYDVPMFESLIKENII